MNTTDKPDGIKFKLERFTSDEIEAMLEKSPNFRDMKTNERDKILDAMRNKWWDPATGDAIAIDETGKLVNGQHRLSAAAIYQRETGERLWWWVARGVSQQSAKSMDQGARRTLAEHLRHEGEAKEVSYCAQIAAAQARYAIGDDKADVASCLGLAVRGRKRVEPSLAACMDQWRRHKGAMQLWATEAHRLEMAKLPRAGLLAALGFYMEKRHEKDAWRFFELLRTGEGMQADDPVMILRKRLLESRMNKSSRLGSGNVAALTIKAFNAWANGQTIGILRWTGIGPYAEEFPRVAEVAA